MSVALLSTRYAKALKDLAIEQGSLEQVKNDVVELQGVIKQSKDLELLLKSPIIHTSDKQKVFEKLFKGKVNHITYEFLDILLRKRRERFLVEVLRSFIDSYNDYMHIMPVSITSAVPLSDSIRNEIIAKVKSATKSEKVQLEEKVDETILGGYILHFDNMQFDESLKKDLLLIKKQFEDNEYIRKF